MWKLSSEDRLTKWRDFRKTLESRPIEEVVLESYELWKTCPFSPYYLDVNLTDNWPSPWQLLIDNYYCDVAKCLGIIYTVCLSMDVEDSENFDVIVPEIRQYVDEETNTTYTVASFVNGKYIANFLDDGLISEDSIPTNFKLIRVLNATEMKLSSIL